jgi:uncharacterized protein YjiS (DUF1127 family)
VGDAPELLNLVGPAGEPLTVPIDQAAPLLERGFRLETGADVAGRLSHEVKEEAFGGVSGAVAATGFGALRGATLGLSDVAFSAGGMGDELQGLQEINPTLSTVGEIGGALGTAFVAPQSLLAKSPGALATRMGARVAEIGEGGSALAKHAYRTAGAALEGSAQSAGSYVSDVALGNKDLSADAFVGAMGKGALWGGVAGGALSVAGSGLTAARRLFPRSEMTKEAVEAAETIARTEIANAVDESATVAQAARDRLRQIRADRAALDLTTKQKLDDIAITKADEISKAQIAKAQAEAERAAVQLEKAKAPKAPRGKRKAFDDEAAAKGEAPAVREGDPTAGASVVEPPLGSTARVVEDATGDTATLLERQLGATKQGLDAGKTLAELSDRAPAIKPTHIEDALNAEIAKIDPEAEKLVRGLQELEGGRDAMSSWLDKYGGGSVSKFERSQASRAYAEGMRKKEGYVDVLPMDSQRPGFTEGGLGVARGRQQVWRGSAEGRELADARTMSKLSPEEQMAADDAVGRLFGGSKQIAEDVVEGAAPSVDDQLSRALKSKVDSIDDDIADSASALSRLEAGHADLVEALGVMAPPTAQARAQAFREAQAKAEEATVDATARAAADTEKALQTVGLPAAKGKGKLGGAMDMAKDVGTAAEALRMMGIDVPDPSNIPVIGPLLGMYLKARVLGKAFGRFGGKVAETAESTIAGKAATVRDRVYAAADKLLEVGAKGAAHASPRIGGAAAVLGHSLFDDSDPRVKAKPYSSAPNAGTLASNYLARADELSRAMQPNAIANSVRARIKTSDPAILDAIIAAKERKLQFLDSKMPRPNEPPMPGQMHMPWVPAPSAIKQWGRYVEAAEDPAAVIETAANGGHLSIEAVETLKTVYPALFTEAQQRILTRAADLKEPLPYHRRVQLSVLFDMPMDGSQTPEGAAFLQSTYQPPAAPQQSVAPQTTPTVTSDVRMFDRADPNAR